MKDRYPQIPWRDAASIGNRLRHGYDALDDAIVWQVATLDLPALRAVINALLAELDDGSDG